MYGLKHDLESLPPMPVDGDTWSVMYSWALPTRSFLEFVMFSRYDRLHYRLQPVNTLGLFHWMRKILSEVSLLSMLIRLQNVCGCIGCTNV